MLTAGYLLFSAVYLGFAFATKSVSFVIIFLVYGIFTAMTAVCVWGGDVWAGCTFDDFLFQDTGNGSEFTENSQKILALTIDEC